MSSGLTARVQISAVGAKGVCGFEVQRKASFRSIPKTQIRVQFGEADRSTKKTNRRIFEESRYDQVPATQVTDAGRDESET